MPRSLTAAAAAMTATRRLLCTATADVAPSLTHLLALPPVAPSPTADELARLLLAHHNPFHPSESPLQLLSGGGVSLSQELLVQILLRLRGASKLALSLLNAVRLHPSVSSPPSADAYDAVVDALGRAHQFDAAWRLVVEAAADGAATPRTFAVLARRYVAAGLTRQAVRAFDDMEAFLGREPDAQEFTTLLDTLCKYKYPKLDMPGMDDYLQLQQDSVACRVRAKRGCATHPRSIAERERRTRISNRLRRLQDLVPNMDKQTNTSDMLDIAVDYIKVLQDQIEKLKQDQGNCSCSADQKC